MIASMTAFARLETSDWIWEIKSVNHRNLDLSFTLPSRLTFIEPDLRNIANNMISRGRIDTILIKNHSSEETKGINQETTENILSNIVELREFVYSTVRRRSFSGIKWLDRLNYLDFLLIPGVLNSSQVITNDSQRDLATTFEATLLKLIDRRNVEGEALATLFQQRLTDIGEILNKLEIAAASQLSHIQTKLNQRIEKLGVEVDPTRLAQEVALLAQRADVSEEIDRLRVHLSEFENCLINKGPHGRRLGFIVQEMGRESNTLAAKLVPPEALTHSVDLKVLVDQIREQVQNIE